MRVLIGKGADPNTQNDVSSILTNPLKSICLPRSFILLEMTIFCLSCVYNITYVYPIILLLHKVTVHVRHFSDLGDGGATAQK